MINLDIPELHIVRHKFRQELDAVLEKLFKNDIYEKLAAAAQQQVLKEELEKMSIRLAVYWFEQDIINSQATMPEEFAKIFKENMLDLLA